MKQSFFSKDPVFYRSFFKLMAVIALQNLVAYSVNMLDNMMLGSYSQNALSGAATVNQTVQFDNCSPNRMCMY